MVPTLSLAGGADSLFTNPSREAVERALPGFLHGQRWFSGKARQVAAARVMDWGRLPEAKDAFAVVLQVVYDRGEPDLYFVPLAVGAATNATGVIAKLTGPHGEKATLMFANNIMIYKQTKNPDATKTFLKWWSENSLPLWTEGHCGQLPARTSIAKDAYFQNNVFLKRILDEWVPVGKMTGNHATGTIPALADIDSGGMLNTMATDILQGMDPKAALQKLDTTLKGLKSLQ